MRELVKKHSIEVDNLCQFLAQVRRVPLDRRVRAAQVRACVSVQFLAQDRVTKFAEMKPDELLKATQEAVGGDEMVSIALHRTAPDRIGSDRIGSDRIGSDRIW